MPTVALTVEVKDDDINILQVHVTGILISMLCSLKNRIFSSALHHSSKITKKRENNF